MQDDGQVNYLAHEYKDILEHVESVKREFKQQPKQLQHLYDIAKDLFVDWWKFSGSTAPKARIPQLERMLADPKTTQSEVADFILSDRG